ncbi:hypothetical protein HDE_05855 [Halotydeus destructor]|nr:hypothetical protein HDE_05855 [Halotydeus destructor]
MFYRNHQPSFRADSSRRARASELITLALIMQVSYQQRFILISNQCQLPHYPVWHLIHILSRTIVKFQYAFISP